jgi:GTP-binding protein
MKDNSLFFFFVLPKVAIIGRTNVGKSTLFNRLISEKKALVSDMPGTTRDRNSALCTWRDFAFELIDTGGLDISYLSQKRIRKNLLSENLAALTDLEKDVIKQAQIGLKQADLVLFLIDGQAGILPEDRTVLHLLRKHEKPFLYVANKIDRPNLRKRASEFLGLGAGIPHLVSSRNGVGCGDLLDAIVEKLPKNSPPEEGDEINISIVGKPNVGKSSLLNAILGEQRVIVSDLPHTTRESHDIVIPFSGMNLRFIDTAGLRRKNKIPGVLEKKGIKKTQQNIIHSDVVLFLVDLSALFTLEDKKIADALLETKACIIIVANKWDLISEKTPYAMGQWQNAIRHFFPMLSHVPIVFLSAKLSSRLSVLMKQIEETHRVSLHSLPVDRLNDFLMEAVKKHPPRKAPGKKRVRFFEIQQVRIQPPKFLVFVDRTKDIHADYIHYLENALQKTFPMHGAKVTVIIQSSVDRR